MIGYQERSSFLGDNFLYPNIFRTVPGYYHDASVLSSILPEYFEWNKVTVMYSNDPVLYGTTASNLFAEFAASRKITILSTHSIDPGSDESAIAAIKAAKNFGARVFVLFFHVYDVIPILRVGYALHLFGPGIQLIGGEHLSISANWVGQGLSQSEMDTYLKGFIGVRYELSLEGTGNYSNFMNRWYARRNTNGTPQLDGSTRCNEETDHYGSFSLYEFWRNGNKTSPPICAGIDFKAYSPSDVLDAVRAYDAVYVVARGIQGLLDLHQQVNGSSLHDFILRSVRFDGVTGVVAFHRGYGELNFDNGGRDGDITYRVVNYQISDGGAGSLVPMMKVLSNVVSSSCDEVNAQCKSFRYSTLDNSQPPDSPLPVMVLLPVPFRIALYSVASLTILMSVLYGLCLFTFRDRRLVKISQPQLSLIMLLGTISICIEAILAAQQPLTPETCGAMLWLQQLGFVSVFGILVLKVWRVHAVSSSMTRTIIGMKAVIWRYCALLGIILLLLSIIQGFGVSVKKTTVTHTQLSYTREYYCDYFAEPASYILCLCIQALVLIMGAYYCYRTRKVDAVLSDTASIMEGEYIAYIGRVRYVIVNVYFYFSIYVNK